MAEDRAIWKRGIHRISCTFLIVPKRASIGALREVVKGKLAKHLAMVTHIRRPVRPSVGSKSQGIMDPCSRAGKLRLLPEFAGFKSGKGVPEY